MKTVGVLGGMGPLATADFFRRLVQVTDAHRDQDHLHVLIDNRPTVPDRTAFLTGGGLNPAPVLIDMAQGLVRQGADLLVVACNTANVFADAIRRAVSVQVVDWPGAVAETLRMTLGPGRRVGVLATAGTASTGLYWDALARCDLHYIAPSPAEQRVVSAAIAGVKAGAGSVRVVRTERVDCAVKAKPNGEPIASHRTIPGSGCCAHHGGKNPSAHNLSTSDLSWPSVQRVAGFLTGRGADAILLACTELSCLAVGGHRDPRIRYFDAAQIVAERVVVLAGARLREAA